MQAHGRLARPSQSLGRDWLGQKSSEEPSTPTRGGCRAPAEALDCTSHCRSHAVAATCTLGREVLAHRRPRGFVMRGPARGPLGCLAGPREASRSLARPLKLPLAGSREAFAGLREPSQGLGEPRKSSRLLSKPHRAWRSQTQTTLDRRPSRGRSRCCPQAPLEAPARGTGLRWSCLEGPACAARPAEESVPKELAAKFEKHHRDAEAPPSHLPGLSIKRPDLSVAAVFRPRPCPPIPARSPRQAEPPLCPKVAPLRAARAPRARARAPPTSRRPSGTQPSAS